MNRRQRRANSKSQQKAGKPSPQVAACSLPRAPADPLQEGFRYHQAGRLAEAEARYQQVLAAEPSHADALHLLGVVSHQAGRSDLAVELIRLAIKQSGQPVFYLNLGTALKERRRPDEAVAAYRDAIRIKPDFAEAQFALGNVLIGQRRLDEAGAAYREAIRIKPDFAEAHFNLGHVLTEQLLFDEAAAAYRAAIRIKPGYAEAYCNLGAVLRRAGKASEAIAEYQRALAINSQYAEVHCNLSGLLLDQGRLDEAIAATRQAIALKPDMAEAYDNLGIALQQLGKMSESRAALRQAVQLAPRNAKYRGDLGQITQFVPGDPQLAEMERLAEDSNSLPVDDRIALHFALGKAYDDVGRHAEAFCQWRDGNALKRKQIKYDEAATLRTLNRTQSVFTSEFIEARQTAGHPSAVPLFIVGMPRSGTTLVEQILASHPQVRGAGELTNFPEAALATRIVPGGATAYPERLLGMADEDYRDLGKRYLAELERLAAGATHVTDKLPANFMYAGLIHLALPNARIMHVARDPLDTCLSCFSKSFTYDLNYTYDLGELGRYYRQYQRTDGALASGVAAGPDSRCPL